MGARLVARGKSRAFDWKSSPLASGPVPLALTLAIAAEAVMNDAGSIVKDALALVNYAPTAQVRGNGHEARGDTFRPMPLASRL